MSKILSIVIPTYNMEALLPRCMDSLVDAEVLDRLDVIIVNDGSRDGSLAIAQDYASRFPESVRVIDKANGNYGSTINAALPVAEGLYIKILDSDDRFDTKALDTYVKGLEALPNPVDMSISHFRMIHSDGSSEVIKYNVYGREPFEYGRIYDMDEVLGSGYIRYFLMHSIAYRTELLRDMSYRQTEGISYTDVEWDTYPLFHTKNIVFHNVVLYQYYLDREGQTMDPAVIRKSLPQMEKMTLALLDHYRNEDVASLSGTRLAFIKQHYQNRVRLLVKTHLMDIPKSEFSAQSFSELDSRLRSALDEFEIPLFRLYPVNKLIRVDAYAYWCKHHSRFPDWLEKLNAVMDRLMTGLFKKLFH